MEKIRLGIVGYGNVGRGVELSIKQNEDMELVAIFTRRPKDTVKSLGNAAVVDIQNILEYKDQIDVLLLCGGSATDLPVQGPEYAKNFNIIDTFDTHAKIPEYFQSVEKEALAGGKLALISTGWDPGLFSLNRLLGEAILPKGQDYTFWGKGVSQGHSDAIRRVKGVKNGIQYTVPIDQAIEEVRAGSNPIFKTDEKHKRVCYVVLEEGANEKEVEETIVNMPNYFKDYHVEVNFISEEELTKNHQSMPHGGFVIRTGITGEGTKARMEFQLELGSNPEFTASVMVAYSRAIARGSKRGETGCLTVLEIPLADISAKSIEELRKELL